jgi:hypothetical protein
VNLDDTVPGAVLGRGQASGQMRDANAEPATDTSIAPHLYPALSLKLKLGFS